MSWTRTAIRMASTTSSRGNDDAIRAIRLYVMGVADAIEEGRNDAALVSADEFVEVQEEAEEERSSAALAQAIDAAGGGRDSRDRCRFAGCDGTGGRRSRGRRGRQSGPRSQETAAENEGSAGAGEAGSGRAAGPRRRPTRKLNRRIDLWQRSARGWSRNSGTGRVPRHDGLQESPRRGRRRQWTGPSRYCARGAP